MIKIENREVKISGKALVVVEEMVMGTIAVLENLKNIYGREAGEKILRESIEIAFLSEKEREKKAIDAFVKIAKKVNRPQEDE